MPWGWVMTFVQMVLWSAWSTLALLLAVLFMYRASLVRDEEDLLFLDDSLAHEKAAQMVLLARIARVEPVVRVTQWLVAGMSTVVIVYYVRDIMLQLNMLH
jgi:hypothetical protein